MSVSRWVIDEFLDPGEFQSLSREQVNLHQQLQAKHWNLLSAGKSTAVLKENSLNQFPSSQFLLKKLSSADFCGQLGDYFSLPARPAPLSDYSDKQGHSYFHKMNNRGLLGPHVDRSFLESESGLLIKVCNVIVYLSPFWRREFGGRTFFGSHFGKKYVEYVPNRAVAFLHDSSSFHGVERLRLNAAERFTVYMDYYLPASYLSQLNRGKPRFWKHDTIYLPELGSLKTYFSAKHYSLDFIKYLLNRFRPSLGWS